MGKDLFIEDDFILDKRPVDIKKLKPGRVITTELGISWDTLLRHKIVKQADVLLLMVIHRRQFTKKQLENAWNFYEPITLHDSSLSCNTHCIVANELGYKQKADFYFQQTARLDIEDVMANTFLGIHAANAGGTWQCVVNGFAGMRMDMEKNRLEFNPHLPSRWKKVEFKIHYKGGLFAVTVQKKSVRIERVKTRKGGRALKIEKNKIIAQS